MDIQSIAAVAGFFVGVAYVIGGLIVNIHLSKYGITEYGVLRISYLVVGLIYIIGYVVVTVADTVAVGAIMYFTQLLSINPYWIPVFWGVMSCMWGIFIFRRITQYSFVTLMLLSFPTTISLIFSLSRVVVVGFDDPRFNDYYGLLAFIGFTLLIGFAVIQVYFYAKAIYGNPKSFLAQRETIGMGIPLPVQLAFDGNGDLIKGMGIPAAQPNLTDRILLINETDNHYIIGIEQEPKMRVVKIVKEAIKGIVYLDVNSEKAPPKSGHQTSHADHS